MLEGCSGISGSLWTLAAVAPPGCLMSSGIQLPGTAYSSFLSLLLENLQFTIYTRQRLKVSGRKTMELRREPVSNSASAMPR